MLGLWLAAPLQARQEVGTLIVSVVGLPNDNGVVRFGLYKDKASYDRQKGAARSVDLPIHNGRCIWQIDHLAFGEYAIMLHHDENANGKMDKNFIGLPKEGYGFSNDAEPGFSAPYFSEARFDFTRPSQRIEIHLQP
jgi:uncharacterized protein (DUF2141 family)